MLDGVVAGDVASVHCRGQAMRVDAYALWSSIGVAGWGCYPGRVNSPGGLRLRLTPHVANNIEAVLPNGSELALPSAAPIASDGRQWYRVNSEYGPGWCMAAYVVVLAGAVFK